MSDARVREMARLLRLAFGDNKAALGRRLGYKDGSFVGQMLRGEKAITEGTWSRLCELREVKPFLHGDMPVYALPNQLREPGISYVLDLGNALPAHAMSQRQQIVSPRTLGRTW